MREQIDHCVFFLSSLEVHLDPRSIGGVPYMNCQTVACIRGPGQPVLVECPSCHLRSARAARMLGMQVSCPGMISPASCQQSMGKGRNLDLWDHSPVFLEICCLEKEPYCDEMSGVLYLQGFPEKCLRMIIHVLKSLPDGRSKGIFNYVPPNNLPGTLELVSMCFDFHR